jgi:hypothetical protein
MTARSVLVVMALAFMFVARPAAAEDPGRVFSGRIMTSTKRFPLSSKSQSQFIANVRKLQQLNFMEDKASHTWTVYFLAFLKSPLNDVEYVIKFYDVTRGGQQLLGTMEEFNDERGQTSIASKMTLDKTILGVNKELLVTLENKGKVYATTRIKILGEGEKYTGKVNFSEDDAGGNGSGAD